MPSQLKHVAITVAQNGDAARERLERHAAPDERRGYLR